LAFNRLRFLLNDQANNYFWQRNVQVDREIGFQMIHQKGSHVRYKHLDGRMTVVPIHANEDLGKGLLLEILKQIKLDRQEYDELRKRV